MCDLFLGFSVDLVLVVIWKWMDEIILLGMVRGRFYVFVLEILRFFNLIKWGIIM